MAEAALPPADASPAASPTDLTVFFVHCATDAAVAVAEAASAAPGVVRCDAMRHAKDHGGVPRDGTKAVVLVATTDAAAATAAFAALPGVTAVVQYTPRYPAAVGAFRYPDPAAPAVAEDFSSYRPYLVFFHIKPECVAEFTERLLAECATVLDVEYPGMMRYDLLQRTDDATRFVVVEVVAGDHAMRAHEARRTDGSMRAALARIEATSRKVIPATGEYALLRPTDPAGWRYPAEWRESVRGVLF